MNLDWESFSTPTLSKTMLFKREIFNTIIQMVWSAYKKTGDEKEFSAIFLAMLEDHPEMKDLFDTYYEEHYGEGVWPDKKIILRFLTKLTILYESLEIQTENV